MFTLYGLCSYVASWMIESKGVWNLAKVRVSRLLGRARSVHRVKARKLKRFLLTLRDHFQIGNLLPIFWVIKNLHGGSVVVETSSTCLKDGCHCLCYTTWNIVKRPKKTKKGRNQGFRKRSRVCRSPKYMVEVQSIVVWYLFIVGLVLRERNHGAVPSRSNHDVSGVEKTSCFPWFAPRSGYYWRGEAWSGGVWAHVPVGL